MKRPYVASLIFIAILLVAVLVGYGLWYQEASRQAVEEEADFQSCSNCTVVKKDLADQVKRRKQNSERAGAINPP